MDGAWWHDVRSGDIDELAQHLNAFQWRYDQLGAGSFLGHLAEIDLPHMAVFREQLSHSTRQIGTMPPGTVGLVVPWSHSGSMWLNGASMTNGHIALSDRAEVEFCTSSDCDYGFMIVDAGVVEDALGRTGAQMAPHLSRKVAIAQLPGDSELALRQLFALAHGSLGEAPESLQADTARRLLADQFVMELVEILSKAAPAEERNAVLRKRVVDRARDLMLSHLDEPLSILDVCKHVGASRRKLNYCFQEVLGTTPLAYMRAIRLNGVRREMLACADKGEGVYDIAVRWGFWHFGQFSTDYKHHFGELPSHTLQRGRDALVPR